MQVLTALCVQSHLKSEGTDDGLQRFVPMQEQARGIAEGHLFCLRYSMYTIAIAIIIIVVIIIIIIIITSIMP